MNDIYNKVEGMTMTTKDINDYRLTDMEEPTDEMLSQIMREAAEEARISNEEATRKFFDDIMKAV